MKLTKSPRIALFALSLAAGAAASAAPVQPAAARDIGGSAGIPVKAGLVTCFWAHTGGVQNLCGTTAEWEVPLPIDTTSGAKKIRIIHTDRASCSAYGASADGGVFLPSWHDLAPYGIDWTITTVTGITLVPGYNTLTATCTLPNKGRMQSIDWNP